MAMSYRTAVVALHLRRPLPRFLVLSEKEAFQKDVYIARDTGGTLQPYDTGGILRLYDTGGILRPYDTGGILRL